MRAKVIHYFDYRTTCDLSFLLINNSMGFGWMVRQNIQFEYVTYGNNVMGSLLQFSLVYFIGQRLQPFIRR